MPIPALVPVLSGLLGGLFKKKEAPPAKPNYTPYIIAGVAFFLFMLILILLLR